MQHTDSSKKKQLRYVTFISLIAAIGGFLFGYDTAVISGAIGFIEDRFVLSSAMVGWVVSSLIIGCIVGAASSGFISDKLGRKSALIISGVLFTAGSAASALPETVTGLVLARMFGGLGVGMASTLAPLYIAEIAPAKYRGRLVSLYQLAVVTAIFVTFFIDSSIASLGDTAWDIETGWRWMFAVGVIPGILFIIFLLFIPESPRWLQKQGKSDRALATLQRLNGKEEAKFELKEIRLTLKEENTKMSQLFKPGLRLALLIGVILAILQQVTGINAVMYYAPEIFKATGAGTDAALVQTVMIGLINFIFTILALWLIDKMGRKALLLIGSTCMAVCLVFVGFAFHSGHTEGPWVLVFLLLYVASFAISLGPVVWVVISEIFPNRVRARATAIASMALWAADYLVSQAFPMMLDSIGPATTFWVFAVMSVFTFFFTWKTVPETKGKTLEEIDQLWSSKA
ncbi:sugar porter family MFS transporter [Marinicrinis lubricantis]|uniref:Sugar porter family MFS transporter n=1 Tax=Marinicrinis lubricantis TaxID=2086470 RepID=A0ABW1IJZ0_9BACL